MERHTGSTEKSEVFGGKRYQKMHHAYSKPTAENYKKSLHKRGYNARVECEGRGHYNVYGRRR